MRILFSAALLFFALTVPDAGQAASPPNPGGSHYLQAVLEKIATYKVKDLQKLTGRKFTVKEKISFWLLKRQLKKRDKTEFSKTLAAKLFYKKDKQQRGTAIPEEKNSKGQTAFIFGLIGAILLVAALFVPYIIIASLVSAILAIALGTVAYNRDRSDVKAKTGKLLGWITLGLFAILLIVVVIALSSSSWW